MKHFLFILLATCTISAQNQYPKDYFRSPLNIPLFLSGNFGELRANHFHTGLDFKTQQKIGFPVFAAADGHVSRIKISAYGYGKAIYIDHPNGYTTVYGHLSQGSPAIEAYIKAAQYKAKSFEVEMFPTPDELPVKKGDTIALSGNTGGSGGPHLHFECRDTKTEKIINPMLFGFDAWVADTKAPVITSVLAYPMDDFSNVNQSQKPLVLNLSLQKDGSYIADKITATGKIGFGISTYDISDANYTKTGVFDVQAFSNGTAVFGYEFDTFDFKEARYVNALLDYDRFKRTGMRTQELFMTTPYPLSIIRTTPENGIITVAPNLTQMYKIEVSDFNNNKVNVVIPIDYSILPPTVLKIPTKQTNYLLKAKNDNNYAKDNVSVFIPANTFYADFYLDFDVKDNILTLQDDYMPVHSNLTITFEDTTSTETEKSKMFIASVDGKKLSYNPTTRKGNSFVSYTKNLGKFTLAKDTIGPKITPVNIKEGKWLSKQTDIQLTIGDNLSGINEFNGYLNGNWILLEYDYKTKKLTHKFSDNIVADGRNDLKVVVSDNVGNSTIFETHFFRKK
ncbi:MAG: M23 family metallopeptidase [Flavobacterium sp.]|nr:M23 family metallopeptidase [Flavobacterium sp.]